MRLSYLVWFETRSSVLDAFDESVKADIRGASSLDELLDQYKEAKTAVKDYEADPNNPQIEGYQRSEHEPYKSESLLREAIADWEAKAEQVSKVRAYLFFGFGFFLLGVLLYRVASPWIGLAALKVAFSEMVYWSSPPTSALSRSSNTSA